MVVCTRETPPQRAQRLQRVTQALTGAEAVFWDTGHMAEYSSSRV